MLSQQDSDNVRFIIPHVSCVVDSWKSDRCGLVETKPRLSRVVHNEHCVGINCNNVKASLGLVSGADMGILKQKHFPGSVTRACPVMLSCLQDRIA